jgi:3-dehydroquinate synthase
MYNNFESSVFYIENFDTKPFDVENDLLIIDAHVAGLIEKKISHWQHKYLVPGGEDLKEFTVALKHIEYLCSHWGLKASRSSRIVVCGGGSVGDFGAFFASILKRGVHLVHIPSTWLAALDSAHGGKTGLNFHRVKNQIGTFYAAEQIYIFKDLLFSQPEERGLDGFGECFKMMVLDGESTIWNSTVPQQKNINEFLWSNLSSAVNKKYKIVKEDPYELLGQRKILNLGHTFGHVLETFFEKPHGLCVLQGLIFSLRWSVKREYLEESVFDSLLQFVRSSGAPIWEEQAPRMLVSVEEFEKLVLADKKSTGQRKLDFIFIEKCGTARIEKVSIDEMVTEARRQGWVG